MEDGATLREFQTALKTLLAKLPLALRPKRHHVTPYSAPLQEPLLPGLELVYYLPELPFLVQSSWALPTHQTIL